MDDIEMLIPEVVENDNNSNNSNNNNNNNKTLIDFFFANPWLLF